MSDRKAVIKNADMSEEMQQDAVDCATQALEKYNIEKVRSITKCRCEPPYLGIRILFDVLWHGKKRNEEKKNCLFLTVVPIPTDTDDKK